MDRLTRSFSFLLMMAAFSGRAQTNHGQFSTLPRETIFAFTNTNVAMSGEKLFFKLYCLNESTRQPSLVSRVAYIMLIGSDFKPAITQKIQLSGGLADGALFIPTQLKTGNYKLLAYTNRMLTTSRSNFMQLDVTIINPFEVPEQLGDSIAHIIQPAVESKAQVIQTNQLVYGTRAKVTISIDSKIAQLSRNYVLSVKKVDGLSQSFKGATSKSGIWVPQSPPANVIPEIRGELVTGKLVATSDKKAVNQIVSLSFPGNAFMLKLFQTDKDGQFRFILNPEQLGNEAYFQVMGPDRDGFRILLDQPVTPDFTSLQISPTLTIDSSLKHALESRSVANQIENAYFKRKQDSIVKPKASASFFHPLEKRYVLDDYTRFKSLAETITEVVLEMYTHTESGKRSIHLRNNNLNPEMYGDPLILVDGLPIQDTNELYDYNPDNIYAIDLVNQPYAFGPKTFSGVANIVTKNNDYQMRAKGDFLLKAELNRPAPHKKYFAPDYSEPNSGATIPDYRYQLYWNPNVTFTPTNVFSFYTSDVKGSFEIVLSGFDQNGNRVEYRSVFSVK